MKYGVTANLTADLTVNTDFAQVEIDEQQVNLTRFNLFFPEKRDFFLEGRGIFDFARGGAGAGPMTTAALSDTPYLFYSRRIGLNRNREVPIIVGGRLTGKVGEYAVGVMNIQTGEETVSGTRADELHRAPREARHPAPQHDRRDVHEPVGVDGRRRLEPGVRRRCGLLVLRERQHGRVLRANGDARASTATIRRATRGDSTTAPIATARAPST